MAFATYADLKASLADWLNRTDLVTQIPDFIAQAEATLNKVVRNRLMIASVEVTILLSDRVGLPADLLDILYVTNDDVPTDTLVKQVPEWIAKQQRQRLRTAGNPLYFCIIGPDMLVCPMPSGSKTYRVDYYKKIPALTDSNTSNWLLTNHPDLYLYTALMHAYPFLKDEERSTVMGNQMVQMVQSLLKLNETTTLEGADYDVNKG